MPKTTKLFDWEIRDKSGELIDVLSMSRDDAKRYKKNFPEYSLQEIEYTDGGDNESW